MPAETASLKDAPLTDILATNKIQTPQTTLTPTPQ